MVFHGLLYESLLVDSHKLMGKVSYEDAKVFGVLDDHKLVRDVAPQHLEVFGVVMGPQKGLQLRIGLA